jgi:hypothetical protein
MLGLSHSQESIVGCARCKVPGNAAARKLWFGECWHDDVKVQLLFVRNWT